MFIMRYNDYDRTWTMLMNVEILNQFKSDKGERKPGHPDLKLLLTDWIILLGFWMIDVSGGGDNLDIDDNIIKNHKF